MKTSLRSLGLLCLFLICWASAPSRDHLALCHADDSGPADCPLPVPEPPVVHVPVLAAPDPPTPVVVVRVRVPACIQPDQNLEYHICVENCSAAPAHHVVLRNALPGNTKFVRASPEPHKIPDGKGDIQWNLGTLPANGKREITLILHPTGTEDITNCTRIQFEHGQCVTTRLVGSAPAAPPKVVPLPGKEPSKESTKEPPIGAGKLRLNMNGPRKQNVEQATRYTITVHNQGGKEANNVLVDTFLPDKLAFLDASQNGKFLAGKVAWVFDKLEPGKSRSVELTVRAKEPGEQCLKTKVLADGGLSTEGEICTTFVGASALLLEMYDREDPIPIGGTTSYPIWVQNQGQVPVTNLRIEATVPDGMELAKARGPVDYKVQGKTVTFEPLSLLEPGNRIEFEVYTRALTAGDQRFRIQLTADQLREGGPVHETESTTVYNEDGPPVRIQTQSRQSRVRRIIPLDP